MKIILAVDGSKHSRWATELLLGLPLSEEPEIVVLQAVDVAALTHPFVAAPHALMFIEAMRKEIDKTVRSAEGLTVRIANRLRARWKNVTPAVEKGSAAEAVIQTARTNGADLIILGSRGLSRIRSFLMGSVSTKVAIYAPCSVLVVKRRTRSLKKVLVALDGSRHSEKTVGFLKSHFRLEGIQGTALYAWEYPLPTYFPKMAQEETESRLRGLLADAGFRPDAVCVFGHPVRKILEAAKKKKADLVVVGSKGLTGLERVLLGGVSHKVAAYSPTSVLIVRDQGP